MRGLRVPAGVGLASGLLVLGASWPVGLVAAVPLAVCTAAVAGLSAGWPDTRVWLSWGVVLAAGASLAGTVVSLLISPPFTTSGERIPYADGPVAGLLGLLEVSALLVLLAFVVRAAPRRRAVGLGLLLVGADLAWLLRVPPAPTVAAGLATLLVWFAGPVTAGIAGGYPRLAEARQRRSVTEARRAQRLRLAGDLHDFVAHDITGIVVQAQAAQHVAQANPAAALEALRRIEAAGLHALVSMDEALGILREGDSPRPGPAGVSLPQVRALLESFTVANGPAVDAQIDQAAWERLPPEMSALIYRVLAEALTNIRRHAPETPFVCVGLASQAQTVELVVSNELPTVPTDHPARGGRGLPHLAELVVDGGGALTAGPAGDRWQLRVVLPVQEVVK